MENDGLVGFYCEFCFRQYFVYWTNQRNEFGIKGKNDWIGHKLDDGIDSVKNLQKKP